MFKWENDNMQFSHYWLNLNLMPNQKCNSTVPFFKKKKTTMNKLPSNHILMKFLNLKVHAHTKFYKYTDLFKKMRVWGYLVDINTMYSTKFGGRGGCPVSSKRKRNLISRSNYYAYAEANLKTILNKVELHTKLVP